MCVPCACVVELRIQWLNIKHQNAGTPKYLGKICKLKVQTYIVSIMFSSKFEINVHQKHVYNTSFFSNLRVKMSVKFQVKS